MIHDCDNCKHAETPAFFEPCASCGGSSYWEPYVRTNADCIRAMTDEELADWLIMNGDGSDYQTWLDWLKEVASIE